MSRQYPRFLYSDPKNVKTPGPFIVHLLEPRLVFKVIKTSERGFTLQLLDKLEFTDDLHEAEQISKDAHTWLYYQIRDQSITI